MAGTLFGGNTPSYQVLLTQFQSALTDPLPERCAILTHLLQDSPLKELQYVFPAVVESIFGFHTGQEWGLLTLDKNIQCREFESLRRFLAAEGPLLRLTIKFTEEFSPKFEFPVACLPGPTQLMFQEGKISPLYANKLQTVNPGFYPSVLQLNAFEFYLFHFTYFIANSSIKSSSSTVNQQDTLYAHILEDYLFSLLPTDNRAFPVFQTPSNTQLSPVMSPLASSYGSPSNDFRMNSSRPAFLSPLRERPSLLKKGALVMVAPGGSSSSGATYGTPAESWRSETFLLVLREMLLGQNSMEQQQRGPMVLIPRTFIASHFHVWMVRIMVKHLHFFFNSALAPGQSTSHGQIMIDSLGRLKSLGMTQLIQKEMYCFLKSTFDHWPLDASFRVPLETYLSYIQPWRYVRCDLEPSVWQKFLNENLQFYTTILQQILRRFLRMDLSCPKNAYMLFRLTKVICTGELRDMIMQAEKGSLSKPSSLGMSSFLNHSPEKFSIHKHTSQVETAGYPPLFSEPVFMLVTHLLSSITAAREKISVQSPSMANTSRGFLSKVCSFFETSDDAINSDDNSPADLRKVVSYLETSSNQLCEFFREVLPPTLNITPPMSNFNQTPSTSVNNNNNITRVNDAKIHNNLTLNERYQLLHRKRKPDLEYKANPDLQPVRTYEIPFLVHRLNGIAQHLNEAYANEIAELYHRNSFLGKLSRKLLYRPSTYFDIQKSKDMQSVSRTPVQLPPRINLRILAHRQLYCYLFIYMVLTYLFNFNPIVSFVFLVGLVVFGLIVSTLVNPVPLPIKED
ncbi:hypothetical protein JTE90_018667 [Oedothorax gibbosus]|uniref:Sphingomyelin phosphodiesterase 4 n=1 Tax=Oedothorax gibbosus TaxID=931172 RepID=A0AAV6V2P1_9ARAC|nr:hypothetical protein JTE90_018667 [Oedothorax gibbosus]